MATTHEAPKDLGPRWSHLNDVLLHVKQVAFLLRESLKHGQQMGDRKLALLSRTDWWRYV